MNTFLTKISRLDSVHDVILLSSRGELLFSNRHTTLKDNHSRLAAWHGIITRLGKPVAAEFSFAQGLYYLRYTDLGYVIIGMGRSEGLERVKMACVNVQAKLSDTLIRRKALLKMLTEADDHLKPQIIKELIAVADDEVADALIDLLGKENQFVPEAKERLLLFICQALGHCSSAKAIGPLQEFLHKANQRGTSEDIEQAALISLRQLQMDQPLTERNPSPADGAAAAESRPVKERSPVPPVAARTKNSFSAEEEKVQKYLEQGKKSEAVAFIMEMIKTASRQKMFEKAGHLRDLLIRTDPMSLMEIIHAAEIIEEEKSASISSEYLDTWKNLVEALGSDEFASLYHVMTLKNYTNGMMVAKQGEFRSILYFVNSGRVQLFAVSEGRDVPLRMVGPGEIIGARTFFDPSVWTINAKSLGAELFLLPREKLLQLKENYPAIESKLFDFHARFQVPNTLFTKTKKNRRASERKTISGRVAMSILDKNGNDTGIGSKGDLFDISKGGISFCLRISQKKNAMLLFGKRIRVAIPSGNRGSALHRSGRIVAVRGHHVIGNEYSIHVQFDEALSAAEMQQLFHATQGGA